VESGCHTIPNRIVDVGVADWNNDNRTIYTVWQAIYKQQASKQWASNG